MSRSNVLYKSLRLSPLVLGALALAILALGYYLQIGENSLNARKAAAFVAGPPAIVEISAFDPARDITDMNEVNLRAQPVFEHAYQLTYEKSTGEDHAFMVPLVATNSQSDTVIAGIALYTSPSFSFDDVTPELMLSSAVGFGDFGPILELDGKVTPLGQWGDLTDEALAEQGLTLSADTVIFRPYMNGRAAAFAPSSKTIFGLLSKIAGVIGLLALAKLVLRNPSQPDEPTEEIEDTDPVADALRQTFTVPLWKQRRLATAKDPTFDASTFDSAVVEDAEIVLPRKGFGLRKIAIGLVAVLFLLGLVATVYDLLPKTAATEVAQVQPVIEAIDPIAPAADPNRHWTDIDITPIADWFMATYILAVAGDPDAQLLLGTIIGGLFAGLFMLKAFFMIRRSMQPKTTARFDSMGIN